MTDYVKNPTYTDFKESVRVASTASVNINLPGAIMDGIVLEYGDRLLLKDQGAPATNGLYTWLGPNTTMERASGGIDHQISSGMLVIVEEGVTNADKVFMLITDEPIETGVTPLVFVEFGGSGGDSDTLGGEDGSFYLDRANHTGNYVTADGTYMIMSGSGANVTVKTGLDSDQALDVYVDGEPSPRFNVDGSGAVSWSDGAGVLDTNLYRSGAGELSTDGKVVINGELSFLRKVSDTEDGELFYSDVTGDSSSRFYAQADGGMFWNEGGGNAIGYISPQSQSAGTLIGGRWVFRPSGTSEPAIDVNDGNTEPRLRIVGSGTLEWSDALNPADTNLYRDGVGILRTDGVVRSNVAPTNGDDLVNKTYADAVVSNDVGIVKRLAFLYDFAIQGGAQGQIVLTDLSGNPQQLPTDATITGYFLQPLTLPTSGGAATIAVGIDDSNWGSGALSPAVGFATGLFDPSTQVFQGDHFGVGGAISNIAPIWDGVPADVIIDIATADLTGGKFIVHFMYLDGLTA